jgi:hypothetical protein
MPEAARKGNSGSGRRYFLLSRSERGEERPDRRPAGATVRACAAALADLVGADGALIDLGPDDPVAHDFAVANDH